MFSVIGIILVVERAGTVSLVLRYPAIPTLPLSNSGDVSPNYDKSRDYFFSLPSRLIEKLFRPHPPLCGKPMTICLGGTIFCIRAVIVSADHRVLTQPQHNSSTANGSASTSTSSANNSVLFSVVVALSSSDSIPRIVESAGRDKLGVKPRRHSPPPASTSSSGIAARTTNSARFKRFQSSPALEGPTKTKLDAERCYTSRSGGKAYSITSIAVQRVHISLARLCRVLEREQLRCGYVSIQSKVLLKIRDELVEQKVSLSKSKPAFSRAVTAVVPSPSSQRSERNLPQKDKDRLIDENRQATLELMLAADMQQLPEIAGEGLRAPHHGNLAQDLVATFHALARNAVDDRECCSPSFEIFLSGRKDIVYVNGHLAVPVEPVNLRDYNASNCLLSSQGVCSLMRSETHVLDSMHGSSIRSYHTLLFPSVSPEDVLLSVPSSPDNIQPTQPMQRLLTTVHHFKSLGDIAAEIGCPTQTVLSMAEEFVETGKCIAVPVLSLTSKFACTTNFVGHQLQKLNIAFSQQFGAGIHVFLILSLLTSQDKTLGEIIRDAASSRDDHAVAQKIGAAISSRLVDNLPGQPAVSPARLQGKMGSKSFSGAHSLDDLVRDTLGCMVAWLRGRNCIVELKDYLVEVHQSNSTDFIAPDQHICDNTASSIRNEADTQNGAIGEPSAMKGKAFIGSIASAEGDSLKVARVSPVDNTTQDAEQLYAELIQAGCLRGDISTTALGWRLSLDNQKLKHFIEWGLCEGKIRVVTRAPSPGDDWNAP